MDRRGEGFGNYFNTWLQSLEKFLTHLQSALSQENIHNIDYHKTLIQEVFNHYHQYYQEKSNASRQDVLLFLSPPWCSTLETSLLWFSEFRPTMVFTIVQGSVQQLTEEQAARLETAKDKTRIEEREINEAMARLQERVAAPPIFDLARRFGRLIDGEVDEFEEALRGLKQEVMGVVDNADALRGSTMATITEILSPIQTVQFLVAAIEFQLRVRRCGQQRDGQ